MGLRAEESDSGLLSSGTSLLASFSASCCLRESTSWARESTSSRSSSNSSSVAASEGEIGKRAMAPASSRAVAVRFVFFLVFMF